MTAKRKKDEEIYLVRAAYMESFTKAMVHYGVDAEKYYKKVGLPEQQPDDPNMLLPEKPFFQLINLVAEQESIPNFGALVAELTPWSKIDNMKQIFAGSETLQHLLEKFCTAASNQSRMVRFNLEDADDSIMFWYEGVRLYPSDIQMELYRLTAMLQLVQSAVGARWRPNRFWLVGKKSEEVHACALLRNARYSFGQRRCGFAIPKHLLSSPLKKTTQKNQAAISARAEAPAIPADFIESISEIVRAYVNFQDCRIEEVALAVGLSSRTLQRRLRAAGYTFNDLLNREKAALAKQKLLESTASISQVASKLGYSDTSHFDRAFSRWTGVSPRTFRKQNEEAAQR